jgi:TonB family protein
MLVLASAYYCAQPQANPQQRIDPAVAAGNLLTRVEPVYPALARAAGIRDYVTLQAIIGQDGRVADLRVLRGHPLLNDAAIAAVKQWRYKPQPADVITTVTVNFGGESTPPPPALRRPPSGTSTISGRILGADGSPAYEVVVSALSPVGSAIVRTVSDKLGQYRLEGIPPGSYHIQAGLTGVTYFPGTTALKDAVAITIDTDGTAVLGIDFTVPQLSTTAPAR